MFAFLLLTSFESSFSSTTPDGDGIPFPYAYGGKVILVGCLTAVSLFKFGLWRELAPLPRPTDLLLAIGIGLLVIVAWIGLDGLYPDLPFLGARTAFDPTILPGAQKWVFLTARMFGLVLLVPVFEELFWRSFLMRCLIDTEFSRVPVGKVTLFSALATSALFGLAHPEWLPAFLTGLAWAWLLKHTRSLGACVISHLVANLALGLYVLYTHQWKYW
ncbi:MAG: CAAX prenyl protease-related protein [Planctomycetes bacterium SCN 63-9]|nr:MAG: CAAX prenyl protease-related protein [Planctomycetes bacterium SCN 63-9]